MEIKTLGTYDTLGEQLLELLFAIKTIFGPTEVMATLRRRPWIKEYLRSSYTKTLDSLEHKYYTEVSEKK